MRLALTSLTVDGGVERRILRADVQYRRTGGAHAHRFIRIGCGDQGEIGDQFVIDVATARAATATERAEGVDVALVLKLHLATKDGFGVGGDGPQV